MFSTTKRRVIFRVTYGLALFSVAVLASLLGFSISGTLNIQRIENFGDYNPSIATKVLDINGELITEFFSDEKRDVVSITSMPRHMIDALTTREDRDFFEHRGFSIRGTLRAVWQIVTGSLFSGGSTLSQQLAGQLYSDRRDISIFRKLVELWWAFQMERRLSKKELLEQYLNKMPFGHGHYGVEAASQFYFKHPVERNSVAESALLAIQLVSVNLYSPIRNPNGARKVQEDILGQMVQLNMATRDEVEKSLDEYWSNYDWQADFKSTAFFDREDKAPYFSEYIRGQLDENLLGALNIYKDGFTVHTTLDLEYQREAELALEKGIEEANAIYRNSSASRLNIVDDNLVPLVDLVSLTFNIQDIRVAGTKMQREASKYVYTSLTPVIDLASMLVGDVNLKDASRVANERVQKMSSANLVEGALITLENSTGFIKAMVGGSRFDRTNQFNRAVQAQVQPGSAFKPLYYSAALDSRKFTTATMIYDGPVVFHQNGVPYTPLNYAGRWQGNVSLRKALSQSLNIPAIIVLDGIGFDSAIDRAAKLLGIKDPRAIERNFPRNYPLALGVISVSPLQMARAFAIFANQGREVEPIGIRYVEDRNGKIIANTAADLVNDQRRRGSSIEILSPQTAYLMTDILKTTVENGTLTSSKNRVGGFGKMPMAGKTGTTQNWSDAWAIGYSPYITTAVWLGFDTPGNSLGLQNTGAGAAGPIWASYMKKTHEKLQPVEFPRPATGLVDAYVETKSGLLPSGHPDEVVVREIFLEGTAPNRISTYQSSSQDRENMIIRNLNESRPLDMLGTGSLDLNLNLNLDGPTNPDLDLDLTNLLDIENPQGEDLEPDLDLNLDLLY